MADSIPSLRRKLAEAQAEIAALRARGPVEIVREVPVEVPVDRVSYVDRFRDVPVIHERLRIKRVVEVKEIYVTDPVLEATIRELQESLRQCISQSVS